MHLLFVTRNLCRDEEFALERNRVGETSCILAKRTRHSDEKNFKRTVDRVCYTRNDFKCR